LEEAWALVEKLDPVAHEYKVGLQLLTSAGATIVRRLVVAQKNVFLDLKLHEVPSSVAAAVAVAGDLGAKLVSVHAFAGEAVLSAAVRAAAPFPDLRVVALTVITSMNDNSLRQVGVHSRVEDQVRLLGQLAMASGCAGVIASAREASMLRPLLGSDALIITPGIQLEEGLPTDQVRTATPATAFAAGASHIVLGRAIARAQSPTSAFLKAAAHAPVLS
jgi:orotidine-5'-phosphate decarboxylase